MMRSRELIAGIAGLFFAGTAGLFLAACHPGSPSHVDEAGGPTPVQRFVLGAGQDIVLDAELQEALSQDFTSVKKTRALGWQYFQAILKPVSLPFASREQSSLSLPTFRTWYAREEILGMLGFMIADKATESTDEKIDRTMAWLQTRGSKDVEAIAAATRQAERDAASADNLAGLTKVLYSPTLTRSLLKNARAISECWKDYIRQDLLATPCITFPIDPRASVIKMRWMPLKSLIPVFDSTPDAFSDHFKRGQWQIGHYRSEAAGPPLYSQRLANGDDYGLVALNMATKVNRTWLWQAFWWSDTPDSDFGEDRPQILRATILGSMKSCAVVDFTAKYDGELMGDLGTIYGFLRQNRGQRSWCSNPYLEPDSRGAKTNCVGCHQYNGHEPQPNRISNYPQIYPNDISDAVSRAPVFDYLWSLPAGNQLALAFRDLIEH